MSNTSDYLNDHLSSILEDHDVILACTHFPLVKPEFEQILRRPVFDSIKPITDFVKLSYKPGSGSTQIFTSGTPSYLKKQIQSIFNKKEEVSLWNS